MTALTQGRTTELVYPEEFVADVAAAKKCFMGGIACLDASGNATPGATALGLRCAGRFEEEVDNLTGLAGDKKVKIRSGAYGWNNSASADQITAADRGKACYIVDDQTVAKTDGGGTRSRAGVVHDINANGQVIVKMGLDVAGAGEPTYLSMRATNLVGTTVYGIVSPVAGKLSKLLSVLKGAALATGDATLTARINGTPVTGGVITITQAASAIGDKDSASPSALNTIAVGDEIQLLVGGTNSAAAAFAEVTLVVDP